jgi:hypothetical protein
LSAVEPHHPLQPEYERFLPPSLGGALVEQYIRLKNRAWSGDHEGVQETGGKIAEHALRAAQHLGGAPMIGLREEIRDMPAALRRLEALPRAQAPDSVRLVIPRVIATLYTLRNKRSGGHTASEVDPGPTDALLTERIADWLMAELLRLGHKLPLEEAQGVIASLTERRIPVVYRVGKYRRVLKTGLAPYEELLVLLYGEAGGATIAELEAWSRIPRTSLVRYVEALEAQRLVRTVKAARSRRVFILPTGERRVEESGWLAPE